MQIQYLQFINYNIQDNIFNRNSIIFYKLLNLNYKYTTVNSFKFPLLSAEDLLQVENYDHHDVKSSTLRFKDPINEIVATIATNNSCIKANILLMNTKCIWFTTQENNTLNHKIQIHPSRKSSVYWLHCTGMLLSFQTTSTLLCRSVRYMYSCRTINNFFNNGQGLKLY